MLPPDAGTQRVPEELYDCPLCSGKGVVRWGDPSPQCHWCQGKGQVTGRLVLLWLIEEVRDIRGM